MPNLEVIGNIQQRIKCGEVYAINTDDSEIYVECFLCSDHPICSLSEFSNHLEIWHSDWEKETNDPQSAFQSNTIHDKIQFDTFSGYSDGEENYDSIQPFEEVLIQSDNEETISPTSNSTQNYKNEESDVEELSKICQESFFEVTQQQILHDECEIPKDEEYDMDVEQENLQHIDNDAIMYHKLQQKDMQILIELYKKHPSLWNRSHTNFGNTKASRDTWKLIAAVWNKECKKNMKISELRMRMTTLCQRYMKERDRLEAEGILNEKPRFRHYNQLKFLEENQTLQNRYHLYELQNSKLIEVYKHFPVLWHISQKNVRVPEQRSKALASICIALKLCGIYLSPRLVIGRLQVLLKKYSNEKIRLLQCLVNGADFEMNFQHFKEMNFLDKHVAPFVCVQCGKVFETLLRFKDHLNSDESHEKLKQQMFETDTLETLSTKTDQNIVRSKETVENGINLLENLLEDSHQVDGIYDLNVLNTTEYPPKMQHDYKPIETSNKLLPDSAIIKGKEDVIVKIDCEEYSYDLKLNNVESKEEDIQENDISTTQCQTEETFTRLTTHQTHKLISIYRNYPELWDPNHMYYNSRKSRRIAWRALTNSMNKIFSNSHYGWKTLHRKLTDFVKYYKREKEKIESEESCTKWCFFDDFAFLDEVSFSNDEQKSFKQKSQTLKLIEIYKNQPQLWDTNHVGYKCRVERQNLFNAIHKRWKEECKMSIALDKLKQKIVDLRSKYKFEKRSKHAALKRNDSFKSQFEFYEALEFLEPHISPFLCSCGNIFQKMTDYERHQRKAHGATEKRTADDESLINVCHICGIKFTLRCNLVAHLNRHQGNRNYACSYCPKAFFNATSLKVHERSHTKEYPYVCEHCGRSYVNASKLNQHLKRHTGIKEHACTKLNCDKAFYTAFDRDVHERKHLNIRDKICPVCGKTFKMGSSYYAHMMLHSNKRYSCEKCGREFAQYPGLYKHRKKCRV